MADQQKFEEHGIVPLLMDKTPPETLSVEWREIAKKFFPGDEMTPTEVKTKPILDWRAYQERLYTVIFVNLGSTSHPTEAVHWLVYNIPGDDIPKGRVQAEYIASGPAEGTGLHRYVYLVYQQPSTDHITPDEPYMGFKLDGRTPFNTREIAKKYGLGEPVAANFYLAQYDAYVPTLLAETHEKTLLAN